jgi:DNA-directed RNA polymerase specialized sigma24 family protein
MNDSVNQNAAFATTQWTVVLNARNDSSPQAEAALGALFRAYWYPLYAYARGRGHDVEDAKDLTQEFFCRVLEKNYFGIADRKRGRFRWFLLTAFKGFLANHYDHSHALKRGGGMPLLSLDAAQAERSISLEAYCEATPDIDYDRRWALTVLEQAQERLREEYMSAGKGERYKRLEEHLPGKSALTSYAEASAALGMTENALKVEVHRMKRRLGALLRAEIAHTVASEQEIDEEVRYLIAAIS